MTHLSLFSGIGGLDLAAEWAGFQTVGQCEWADYPTRVLEKHWPDVPRWRDIRDLTADDFRRRTGIDRPTIVSGGFPCQPFSVAGKQKGKGDDRYLWPEMLRVIRELAPRWVVGENVPGILRIAADEVCTDLERIGYEVGIFDYEAAAIGAPHRRERIVFVAHARFNTGNARRSEPTGQQREAGIANGSDDVADTANQWSDRGMRPRAWRDGFADSGATVCDTERSRLPGNKRRRAEQEPAYRRWWSTEPDVGRVAHGVRNRVDRLKCLGNAVVPQQFYPIFRAIAEIEQDLTKEVLPNAAD